MKWIAVGLCVYLANWPRMILGALALTAFYCLLMALGGGLPLFPFLSAPSPGDMRGGEIPPVLIAVLIVLSFTVGTMLYLGYQYYILKLVRKQRPSVYDLLYPFRRPLAVIAVTLVYYLAVGAGLLFLVVPGVILAMTYIFADIILIDRNLRLTEALQKSVEVTRGYRLSLLLLVLFFLVLNAALDFLRKSADKTAWETVIILSSGFVITPWSYAATMGAYEDLLGETFSPTEALPQTAPPLPPV